MRDEIFKICGNLQGQCKWWKLDRARHVPLPLRYVNNHNRISMKNGKRGDTDNVYTNSRRVGCDRPIFEPFQPFHSQKRREER